MSSSDNYYSLSQNNNQVNNLENHEFGNTDDHLILLRLNMKLK